MAVTLNYVPHEARRAIHEARRYEYEISSTGHLSYNAPAGYHDDCVIALALANQARWQAGNTGSMARLMGGGKRQGATVSGGVSGWWWGDATPG